VATYGQAGRRSSLLAGRDRRAVRYLPEQLTEDDAQLIDAVTSTGASGLRYGKVMGTISARLKGASTAPVPALVKEASDSGSSSSGSSGLEGET
jgi:uncharacterized protein YqeY